MFFCYRRFNVLILTNFFVGENSSRIDDGELVGTGLAGRVATGIGLYMLAAVTCVGNGMVIHAIRTEKRLRKVSCHESACQVRAP